MGFLRLYLAFAVLISHASCGGYFHTFSATTAVQCFFVISGFYMAATFTRNYAYPGGARAFYASRFLRLYPLYLFTLLLTIFAWWGSTRGYWQVNGQGLFDYFIDSPQPWHQHGAVWSMFFQDILSISEEAHNHLPIRQAWSISAEAAFYACVPLLLWMRRRWLYVAIAAAFALKLGVFHAYGFRASYFPFYTEIVYFLIGVAVYFHRARLTLTRKRTLALCVLFVTVMPYYWPEMTAERGGVVYNLIMIGALVWLIPSLFTHFTGKRDLWLGDLSYGVYITHLLFIDLANANTPEIFSGHARLYACFVAGICSVGITWLFNAVFQDRIDSWRRKRFQHASGAV